jgi:hypothetical protein|uniref:Uncharacterized protein n=1 Tax=Zea mays TaxID=4577 RepID=C0PK56_MAIZE|nr:unknown [Zea mays]
MIDCLFSPDNLHFLLHSVPSLIHPDDHTTLLMHLFFLILLQRDLRDAHRSAHHPGLLHLAGAVSLSRSLLQRAEGAMLWCIGPT